MKINLVFACARDGRFSNPMFRFTALRKWSISNIFESFEKNAEFLKAVSKPLNLQKSKG